MLAINNYCVSSRVRIARNVKGLPFPGKMSKEESSILIDSIKGALGNSYTYINFSALPKEKKLSYAERHIVSIDLLNSGNNTALFMNEDKSIAVMVGEEDHIRIQAFTDGFNLDEAQEMAFKTEELIGKNVEFLFDKKYGYITKCPSNIGTGMRASVMMFLPALMNENTASVYSSELARIGITIRGAFGEGSNAIGSLYQLSNAQTLGLTEDEIISKVKKAVLTLADQEETREKKIYNSSPEQIIDTSMRALGTLRYAYMISNEEAQKLITTIRLGCNLGIIEVERSKINQAFSESFPNTLYIISGKDLSSALQRDIFRAEHLKNIFSN